MVRGQISLDFRRLDELEERLMAQVQGWLLPVLLGAIRQG